MNILTGITQVLLGIFFRYVVFAILAYILFYYVKPQNWLRLKIQKKMPSSKVVLTELYYSLLTILIFSVVTWFFVYSSFSVHTKIYTRLKDHSTSYFWLSVLICILMHDTYFYWSHRFMHWKKIFRYVHHIHHRSHNPTPLAVYSFHPFEALMEIGIVPVIVFTLPVHPLALLVFGIYMIALNVIGHLGFELFSKNFMKNRWLKYVINTSTHHNMHHHYSKCNYGLYFNFWDRIMNTNHPRYEDAYNTTFEKKNKIGKES